MIHVAEAGRPLSKFLTRLKRHENLLLGIQIYKMAHVVAKLAFEGILGVILLMEHQLRLAVSQIMGIQGTSLSSYQASTPPTSKDGEFLGPENQMVTWA